MYNSICVKNYLSLIKNKHGKYHIEQTYMENGHDILYYLPKNINVNNVIAICDGKLIKPENFTTTILENEKELIIKIIPGEPVSLITAALIQIAISLIISLAITAIMYFAFPPKKPTLRSPHDEVSYSWEGIVTTQGPGNVVPVVYGENALGGQLLNSFFTTRTTSGGFGGIQLQNPLPLLSMLLGLCEGEIEEIEESSIKLNEQPLSNFPTVTVNTYLGTNPNTFKFGEIKNTYNAGDVEITTTPLIYTTVDPVDAVILEVQFNEGLFGVNTNGGSNPNTSTFQYRTRFSPAGAWTSYTQITLTAEVHSIAYRPVRIEFLTPLVTISAVYDIELTFVSASNMNPIRAKWKPYLHAVTEIVYDPQSYPNTALLSLEATATQNLQGALPNVNVIVKGLKVRQNSFAATPTYTNNPSWCLMDFMTNTRYGAAIPDSEINLASFIDFANYCDELVDIDTDGDGIADDTEKRALLSYVLDTDKQAIDAFEELLSGTRGVLIKSEGQWKIKVAKDETPVQLVNWASTIRDTVVIRYIRDIDDINVVEGRFLNETKNFENDVETYPELQNWPNTVRKLSIQYRGVARNTQVLRELVFELNSRKLPKFTIEFSIPIEGIVFEVMDVINFAYPQFTEGISGRIANEYGAELNSVRQFIMDEDFTYEAGLSYIAMVKFENDTLQTVLLENPATSSDVTTRIAIVKTGDPDLDNIPTAMSSQYVIGVVGQDIIYPIRITQVTRDSDFIVNVQGVHHVPDVYDDYVAYDDGDRVIRPTFHHSTLPPPLTSLFATEQWFFDDLTMGGNPQILYMLMYLEWTVAAIDSDPNIIYAPYGGVIIYTAFSDQVSLLGQFLLGTTLLGGFDDANAQIIVLATVNDPNAFNYKDAYFNKDGTTLYIVVPISQKGVPNYAGAQSIVVTSTGGNFMPPDNFVATGTGSTQITLTWTDITDPRLASTNIYKGGPTFQDASFLTNVPAGTETFIDAGLLPSTTYTYWAANVQHNNVEGLVTTADGTTLP